METGNSLSVHEAAPLSKFYCRRYSGLLFRKINYMFLKDSPPDSPDDIYLDSDIETNKHIPKPSKSLTLTTVAENQVTVSANQSIRLLEAMGRLRKLTVTKPFNRRGIKKLVDYLKYDHYGLELFVPTCNFLRYHERLTAKKLPTLDHKITLPPINRPEDSSSDSDEERSGLAKKDYDAYEVPYEVEKALVGVKNALMAPYVNTGQTTSKRHRVSAPSYLDLLIKRNVVSKDTIYQLTSERNSPALDLSCLIAKPIDIFAIDSVIIPAGSKFIESFLCFEDD